VLLSGSGLLRHCGLAYAAVVTSLVRARIAHTPRNPFTEAGALETFDDGALAFSAGRIVACGDYASVRSRHPEARVLGTPRDAILLPGFVDAHVHYPQLGVIGAMGMELLEWLETRALPLEARMHDPAHAAAEARAFVRALAANGTTTALVFGSHVAAAQEALFADALGLRIASGLVVSDRRLRPELEVSPAQALDESRALIERWHGRGHLRYAVTPRFSLSCSEPMLEVCGALAAEAPGVLVTSHLNESPQEIAAVAELFPWASDYLETYERFGLVGPRTVFAHDVHARDDELRRLAAARACVAHCPSSNANLGSGIFPLREHLRHGVRVALGTDVGAGPRPSVLEEALMTARLQMVRSADPERLGPAHLLYLATRAGADALGLGAEIGDLSPGRSADFVLLHPPPGSTLAAVIERSESWQGLLGAILSLAREESVVEVVVAGEVVFP
jgi:guanine deaminase